MFDLPGPLGTFANFLVIALGFGFIIFIHELGHFLAAKWAGIRVLAFSIGFGQIACSYRKGIGFRRGSSEPEYLKRAYGLSPEQTKKLHEEISPTEYRLSWLPLGGYVKMLGQEDLNPDAVSDEPDSYQNCSVPKRMVVISAGVIMNVISAAILFIIVFSVGLKVFPAKVGFVQPGGPAALATPINNDSVGEGLKRGDTILRIDGKKMYSFEHVLPEIAMSRKGAPVTIEVRREGVVTPIEFRAKPIKNPVSGLLGIRIQPPISTSIADPKNAKELSAFDQMTKRYGLGAMQPGDRLIAINGVPAHSPYDLIDAAAHSDGKPISITIEHDGKQTQSVVQPVRQMQTGAIPSGDKFVLIKHVLGLTGVMMASPDATADETKQGLKPGDIFARIGTTSFPDTEEGIEIVRANAGKELPLSVLRPDGKGDYARVDLKVRVKAEGTIGFYPAMSTTHASFVHAPMKIGAISEEELENNPDYKPVLATTPAASLIEYPGSRIRSIGGTPIETLRDVAPAIIALTKDAYAQGAESFSVPVTLDLPLPRQPDGSLPSTTRDWTLSRAEIDQLHKLGWGMPGGEALAQLFQPEQVIDRSPNAIAAIERGIAESRRVMLQTYLTFLRLFQGSVQVSHLKGPVGIAHLGTQIASQGFIWVLFFMALISINLAVINFLPLPIVDGGQFLMLCYEWIRGRPVPIVVQNIATMAGLVFIGAMFLYVTFNDIKNILGV